MHIYVHLGGGGSASYMWCKPSVLSKWLSEQIYTFGANMKPYLLHNLTVLTIYMPSPIG